MGVHAALERRVRLTREEVQALRQDFTQYRLGQRGTGIPPKSGQFLNPAHMVNTVATKTPTSGRLEFSPVLIISKPGGTVSCDALAVKPGATIQAGGTATIQVGLYRALPDWSAPDLSAQIASATYSDATIKAMTASTTATIAPATGSLTSLPAMLAWAAFLYVETAAPTTKGTFVTIGDVGGSWIPSSGFAVPGKVLAVTGQSALPTSGTLALSPVATDHPVVGLRAA